MCIKDNLYNLIDDYNFMVTFLGILINKIETNLVIILLL